MADTSQATEDQADHPAKRSRMPLVIGVFLALAGGGGGYYATTSGMILGGESGDEKTSGSFDSEAMATNVSYIEVDPLTVSLRAPSKSRHLVFRANLEVDPEAASEVQKLLPRVTDVLNSYLRALDPAEFEEASALTRLRAQMLRRIQVVTGAGKVNDLLIMEFVLN